MGCRVLAASLAITALCAFSGPALSETSVLDRFQVAGWNGEVYADQRGEFSHCIVTAGYNSGIELMFVLDRGSKFRVRLFDPRWELPRHEAFPVDVSIDGRDLGRLDAVAISVAAIERAPTGASDKTRQALARFAEAVAETLERP